MKTDLGLNSYFFKVTGLIIGILSIIVFVICKAFQYDISIYKELELSRLTVVTFGCGLILFLFSKNKNNNEVSIQNKDILNRLFLTALYSCLIIYGCIQGINNDFSIDLLIPVIFFLVVHIVFSVVTQIKKLSNKRFFIFSSVFFVTGAIILYWL